MASLRHLQAERGNALLLSVLILMALTAVGILSVQRTNTDLMVSGNVARSMQSSMAGEAGLFHSLGLLGSKAHAYTNAIADSKDCEGVNNGGGTSGGVGPYNAGVTMLPACSNFACNPGFAKDVVCYSAALPAVDPKHSLSVVQPSPPTAMARMVQDLAYDGEVVWIKETGDTPGNEIGSKICSEVFDVNARGGIPTQLEPAINSGAGGTLCDRSNPNCVAETVVVETRARAIAGPVQCRAR
jgi:hypothetical protein